MKKHIRNTKKQCDRWIWTKLESVKNRKRSAWLWHSSAGKFLWLNQYHLYFEKRRPGFVATFVSQWVRILIAHCWNIRWGSFAQFVHLFISSFQFRVCHRPSCVFWVTGLPLYCMLVSGLAWARANLCRQSQISCVQVVPAHSRILCECGWCWSLCSESSPPSWYRVVTAWVFTTFPLHSYFSTSALKRNLWRESLPPSSLSRCLFLIHMGWVAWKLSANSVGFQPARKRAA